MKEILLIITLLVKLTMQGYCQNLFRNANQSVCQEGDLLFFKSSKKNAITDVTTGIDNLEISHVGIYHKQDDIAYCLEATHKGVVLTPLDSLFTRKKEILVGRVENANIKESVDNALRYLGRPYDYYFDSGDSAIYCSELIQISYINKEGKQIFGTIPMSFHDDKGNITEFWKKHYAKIGRTVPEGAPGSNPGEMSRRTDIKVMYKLQKK